MARGGSAIATAARCRILAAIVVLGPFLAPPALAASGGRLARDVVPEFEAIRLNVDARKPDYSGSVRIDLRVERATASFHLHAREMSLDRVALGRVEAAAPGPSGGTARGVEPQTPISGGTQGPRRTGEWAEAGNGAGGAGVVDAGGGKRLGPTIPVTHTPGDAGLVTITAAAPLAPGAYVLEIDFTNDFDTQAVALYRVALEGESYAFTQLEADDARGAFPCWDEPSFKIPYQVTLVVPEGHVAVSNTSPESEAAHPDGSRTVVFRKTPPLPSYLIAVATGPFDSVPIPGMSVPGRVITPKGQARLASEAAKTAGPLLGALEKYFGRPYPYDKLDLIGVPEFWPGAMENAGAITFADRLLLLDPDRIGVAQRKTLASIMAHEMAHMWFGDLVTMEWWDDLWLNESFASWMGEKVAAQVFPEFRIELDGASNAQEAMELDARHSTRAIRQPVQAMDNLLQAADVLAYDKGQAVLGMFEEWIGPEAFRRGVNAYLAEHAWGNATASDLWGALSKASGKDVAGPMATFLDQPGVPIVSVEPLGGGQVRLSQRRFLNHGAQATGSSRWRIPITLKYLDGSSIRTAAVLLEESSRTVSLEGGRDIEWIHPNAGATGYFRWEAPTPALLALAERGAGALDVRERVGFIGNLSALLIAGSVSGDDYLRSLLRFAADPEPEVIAAVTEGLALVKTTFITPALEEPFARYVRAVLGPALRRIGTVKSNGEPESVTMLRPDLIDWLGDEGADPGIRALAAAGVRTLMSDPNAVDPSLAGRFLGVAALQGDAVLFEAYRAKVETTRNPAERIQYLNALGRFRDPAIVERVLAYSIEGPLRPQEVLSAPRIFGEEARLQDRVFDWTMSNYGRITSRIPPLFEAFLPWLAGGCSEKRLETARAFFADPNHSAPGTDKEFARMAEAVTDCVRLRAREGAAVAAFLDDPAQQP